MGAKVLFRDLADGELALAIHRCESGAFECLVERYQDALFNFALRLLRNEFDAEEVVQDTVLRAHRALLSRYDEQKLSSLALRPWLFRIARNLAFNRQRSRRRHPLLSGDDFKNVAESRTVPALNGRSELLERALACLDVPDLELLELRFFQELPYREIAAVLGGTDSALRGRIYRALRTLRTRLERLGYDQ
jgi:RNA polymerase sigma-70 factor (ECF subfamily)